MYTFLIPSSKQKHTTGSLTHTHTHARTHARTHTHTHTHTQMTSNNYKQKAAGHVTLLANGHFTGSDAPFVCKIPTASSNFVVVVAEVGLAVGTSAGFAPTKECFKRSRWFGKRHKTDAFTKLEEPTIRTTCTPPTVLNRHF